MKPPAPAIKPSDIASVAGRKTRRVQKKLHEAEVQMRTANEVLAHASGAPAPRDVERAVRTNAAAEQKVHEAVEELEVVKEMLEHTDAGSPARAPSGKSGHGVKSLLPHLKPKA